MAKATVKEENNQELDLTKIKEDLECYIDLQIKKGLNEELEKTHNKLIREKNRRIFFKNFTILILLCIIGFLVYLLYTNNYFDKYFNKNDNNKTEVINNTNNKENAKEDDKNKEEEIPKEPTLEELVKEYSYLLDNIFISEESIYLKDYYNGNLTNELKNYLTLNLIDFDNLVLEDDSLIIDSNLMSKAYYLIFDGKNENISFDYNGIKVKYIKALNSYLSDKELVKTKSNIIREIINIEVENNTVKITTIEGLIKDNKLYNVLTNNEIKKYNKKDNLKNYEDKLNKVIYTFKDEVLDNITK